MKSKIRIIAVMIPLIVIISLMIPSPTNSQAQTLECNAVGLEQAIASTGSVLRIDGTAPDMADLTISAVIADTETPVDILIATDRNPFVFFEQPETGTTPTTDSASMESQSTGGAILAITAQNNINVRGGPSTGDAIVGVVEGGSTINATGRNDTGDWVRIDITTDEGTVPGWVFVSLFTYSGDVNSLPVIDPNAPVIDPAPEVTETETDGEATTEFNPNAEPPALYLLVPFFPNDVLNGGEIQILVSAGETRCDPLPLLITPLAQSPGEFERVVMLTGELLTLQRESMNVTRDQLLAVPPSQLDPMVVTLAISQRLYDGPENPDSLVGLLERINNGEFSVSDVQLLDAMFGQSGMSAYLEDEIEDLQTTLEARRADMIVDVPVNGSTTAGSLNGSPIISALSAQVGEFTLQYPTINDAEDLAREMQIATSADFRVNRGATGQVLSDLGVVTATAGLVSDVNPILNAVVTVGSNLIYMQKSRLEHQAYSGPVRFVNFAVRTDPARFTHENATSPARWYVSVVVESQEWRITNARAYDSGRFWTQAVETGTPVDTAAGVLDVMSAVCDRDGDPCGERRTAFTIPPHTWVVNDMEDFTLFEVSRPSNSETYAFDFVPDSNQIIPLNAGTTGLIISAPRTAFGLYRGDGFGDTDVTVDAISFDLGVDASASGTRNLTLAPGEVRNVCIFASVNHQIPESGINDFSYTVEDQSGATVDSGEANRNEVFCFDIGPVEPSRYEECDLIENREGYFVTLESLAQNGPRAGSAWNAGTINPPPERSRVFSLVAVGQAPDEPDECDREGLWYMVIGEAQIVCPGQTIALPVNPVPIPLNADSINAGLSVFGGVGDVLNMPGAELLPGEVASDIQEADVTIDGLQTTDEELSPDGRLFTSIPDIAQEGASYVYTFPIDPSGEMEGEVVMNISFDTDTTFAGDMALGFEIPGLGTCNTNLDFTGYFEPTDSGG